MTASQRIRLEDIFFDMYGDIHRAARRRTGAPHIADDIVHDVYVKCRKFTGDFATREEGRAYLLRIAANLSIDHVRIERRRAEILNELLPVVESNDKVVDDPESCALANDAARQIEAVLADLPALTRQMFILVRLRGMTHQEVAHELGVSKSLVDKYMVQALLRCRDALGGLGKRD